MIIVAFDTIFEQCSLAILVDGRTTYLDTVAGARGQTELILPMLDKALTATGVALGDVGAWAFNQGPGAFSGIRINVAVAQALSVANDAPCVGVSSLEALAYAVQTQHAFCDDTTITAIMDARQNQVYAGDFIIKDGIPVATGDHHERLVDYHGIIACDVAVGDGVELVATPAQKFDHKPDARHIGELAYRYWQNGQAVSAEHALPVYLRNNAWKTLAEQGKATQANQH